MPRDFTHRPTKVGIIGNSGKGKSQYQIRYTLGSKAGRKFIFDHKHEFQQLAGAVAATTYDELDACEETGWFVFDPHRLYPGRLSEAFDFFCDYAFKVSEMMGGTKLFVADELALLTEGQKPIELCNIMEDGRSVCLDVCATSHGINSLHNRIRSQFTELVVFYHQSEPALKVLQDEFGFNPDHVAGPWQGGQRVGGLKPGEFICRSEQGRFQGGRVF